MTDTQGPYRHTLDLLPPVGKRAFVGFEEGLRERARLELDAMEASLIKGGSAPTVCLCTRGRGLNIVTVPYLEGLLGASVRRFGLQTFLSIYRVKERPDRCLPTLTSVDLYKVALNSKRESAECA